MTATPAQTRPRNYIGSLALAAGLIAVIGVIISAAMPAIIAGAAAIVLGSIAIPRANRLGLARWQAIVGIVLGAIPLLIVLFVGLRQ